MDLKSLKTCLLFFNYSCFSYIFYFLTYKICQLICIKIIISLRIEDLILLKLSINKNRNISSNDSKVSNNHDPVDLIDVPDI